MAITDPISPSAAAAILVTEKVIPGITDAAMPDYPFLGLLRAKGRVKYGHAHYEMKWKVKNDLPEPAAYTPNGYIEAPQRNIWTEASLPMRMLAMGASLDEFSNWLAKGPSAHLNWWKEIVKECVPAILRKIASDTLNVDGNAAGYTDRIHGFPSFLGTDNAEINTTPWYNPSDTYAGLGTTLTQYGGDHEYFPLSATPKACFWTPQLFDYTNDSTLLTGTTDTWKDNWRDALSQTSMYLRQRQSKKVDTWLVTPAMYLECIQSLTATEQVNISRGESSLAAKLGYDSISLNGVDIVPDQEMPENTAYGIHWKSITLQCMTDKLVNRYEQFMANALSHGKYFAFGGNVRVETPAHFIKLYSYT